MNTKHTLQDDKVNVKIILSALWVAVMFIYVYACLLYTSDAADE